MLFRDGPATVVAENISRNQFLPNVLFLDQSTSRKSFLSGKQVESSSRSEQVVSPNAWLRRFVISSDPMRQRGKSPLIFLAV